MPSAKSASASDNVVLLLVVCVFVLNLSAHVVGKAFVPKKRVDPIIESVTLEPELEEALASASDAELCDIAGNTMTPSSHFRTVTMGYTQKACWFQFSLIFHQA